MTHISLPTVISDGDTNHEGHHEIIHQALNSGAVNQGIFEGPNPWVDVSHPTYGVDMTGAVDSTLGMIAAYGALPNGGVAYHPLGHIKTTSALTIAADGFTILGAGNNNGALTLGTWITNAATDLFNITANRHNVTVSNIGLQSQAGGGHIFNFPAAWSDFEFSNVSFSQQNAAKSCINATESPIGGRLTNSCYLAGANARSVPLVKIVAGGATVNWGIDHSTLICGGSDTAVAVHVENTSVAAGPSSSFVFMRDLVVENPRAGFLKLLGQEYFEVADIWGGDFSGATTAHLITLDRTGAPNKTTTHGKVQRVKFYGRTLGGGFVDVMVASGGLITFDDVAGTIDITAAPACAFEHCNINGGETTIVGAGATTIIVDPGGGLNRLPGALTIQGNLTIDGANGLRIKNIVNGTTGDTALVAGVSVVTTTKVTAASRIFLSIYQLGTVAAPKAIAVTARVVGTSFTITSADATDTSTISWFILEPA